MHSTSISYDLSYLSKNDPHKLILTYPIHKRL